MEVVAIVGVGLIGGSFALALRHAGFTGQLLGVSSARTIAESLRLGVIDAGATLEEACRQADLIYLAGPIHGILETLPKVAELARPGTLVTDAGSTKARIVAAAGEMGKGQFLGGHPMAGKESRGVGSAEAELFRGRPYLLTPRESKDLETPAAREFLGWVERIGARVSVVSPDEHDRFVAHSSHLPQLLSTALSAALARHPDRASIAAAAGPGLVDSTRLAMSAWEIWRDILDTNQQPVLEALDLFASEWSSVREDLLAGRLEAHFSAGSDFARFLRSSRGSSSE
jgi:prephenate dehydrogenase